LKRLVARVKESLAKKPVLKRELENEKKKPGSIMTGFWKWNQV